MMDCCEYGNEPSGSIKSACVSANRAFLMDMNEITLTVAQ